jgi:15-cis-phytoene synthase
MPPPDLAEQLSAMVPRPERVQRYLAGHSRSFRFALRFFTGADGLRVARVYAYCRTTDDLADRPLAGMPPEQTLEAWLALSRRAYHGQETGIPLLDRVMAEMAEHGVPFDYAEQLVEGMRMDLRGERYRTLPELRVYTHRVASVVGLWLSRIFGIRGQTLLDRAERLGHAMQLTNILRDVGEDLRSGRVYLPLDLLRRHGLDESRLGDAPGSLGYRDALEELMAAADADYAAGLQALREVPPSFGRPVAVAAMVYRGIHDEIRRNRYDNITRRAFVGPARKGMLAARALWELRGGGSGRRAASMAGSAGD